MKVEVEVKGALSRWNLKGKLQQNYLLIEVFGVDIEVPCSEEQLVTVIAAAEASDEELGVDEPVAPRSVFASDPELEQEPDAEAEAEPPAGPLARPPERRTERKLAPIKRPREDDAGIAQG